MWDNKNKLCHYHKEFWFFYKTYCNYGKIMGIDRNKASKCETQNLCQKDRV